MMLSKMRSAYTPIVWFIEGARMAQTNPESLRSQMTLKTSSNASWAGSAEMQVNSALFRLKLLLFWPCDTSIGLRRTSLRISPRHLSASALGMSPDTEGPWRPEDAAVPAFLGEGELKHGDDEPEGCRDCDAVKVATVAVKSVSKTWWHRARQVGVTEMILPIIFHNQNGIIVTYKTRAQGNFHVLTVLCS
jgi:hypothetical protein